MVLKASFFVYYYYFVCGEDTHLYLQFDGYILSGNSVNNNKREHWNDNEAIKCICTRYVVVDGMGQEAKLHLRR